MSQSPSKADFLTRSIHTDTPVGRVIQTRYAGYKFRSRLEARWAVLFDALGLEWEYEPEGYVIDGKPYLPDFRVHSWNAWVECKPISERDRMMDHYWRLRRLSGSTGVGRAIVICGAPDLMSGNYAMFNNTQYCKGGNCLYVGVDGVTFIEPDEFVTLAYRKAMEERFETRA